MISYLTRMKIRVYWEREDDDDDQHQLLPLSGNDCAASKHEYRIKIHFDVIVFVVSCLTLLTVLQLPMSSFHGKPVPVFGFGSLPSAFHVFLLCLMGSCYGSVCSIYIRKTKPKIAVYYFAFAVLSMLACFAIAFGAAVWEIYKALLPVLAGSAA